MLEWNESQSMRDVLANDVNARLAFRRWCHERGHDDELAERQQIAVRIKECAVDGEVNLIVWSRDCDMCEGTSVRKIPATLIAYHAFMLEQDEWAEGPYSVSIVTEEKAKAHVPEFRDRILEAFENGSNYLV